MIGLCLSWCFSCEMGCQTVSLVLISLAEKGNSEKKGVGLVYVLHFSP